LLFRRGRRGLKFEVVEEKRKGGRDGRHRLSAGVKVMGG